jgi:hypothetical protein
MPFKQTSWLFCIASLLVGCAASKPSPSVKFVREDVAPITSADPCATRLQDISGDLLLYYSVNHHLPQSLDELANLPDVGEIPPLVCPVSHQPYIYNRVGIPLPEQHSRIVLYDPTPAHSGFRWGITLSPSEAGKPLIMKVVALHESVFQSQAPQSQGQ